MFSHSQFFLVSEKVASYVVDYLLRASPPMSSALLEIFPQSPFTAALSFAVRLMFAPCRAFLVQNDSRKKDAIGEQKISLIYANM